MAAIGDTITGGSAGSVLFIDSNVKLAQDSNDFTFDPATNTLKSKNQNGGTSDFAIASGDGTATNSSSSSGALTIKTGAGNSNATSGVPAGNSGTVTIASGPAGAASGGSTSAISGDLLLKTGAGGGNTSANSSGGNAGSIILQPGSGGAGTLSNGTGGSTIVRASANGSDILTVRDSVGTTTHVGVANNGNVRVGASSATARLQLGAGTSSLAPLKFTAGTNLSSPEAGAMEFDGTHLFVTTSNGTRRYLTSHVANVVDFGAKGDGSVSDAAAIQAAVSSLADSTTLGDGNGTGGVVYFPPQLKYGIGTTVTIKCQQPIWLISQMGGWNNYHVSEQGYIFPYDALNGTGDAMFKWVKVSTEFDTAGGGGAIGLKIMEPLATKRSKAIHSAIRLENGANFLVRDCAFYYLQGRVFYAGEWANNTYIQRIDVSECGASGKPIIDLQTPINQGYYYISDSELEVSYGAPYVRVPVGGVYLQNVGFEANSGITPDQTFVDASEGAIRADNCQFRRNQATHVVIGKGTGTNYGPSGSIISNSFFSGEEGKTTPSLHVLPTAGYCRFSNLQFIGNAQQLARQIYIQGDRCQLDNIYVQSGGNIDIAAINCRATNLEAFGLNTTESHCIKIVDGCSLIGCHVNGSFATTAAGILATGTTPKVIGCEVKWLAGNPNGIECASSNGLVQANVVYGTTTPYVYANGALFLGNFDNLTGTASDSNSDDIIVLNRELGILTTKSLTTLSGADYTLTLTNSLIGTGTKMQLTIYNGTNTRSPITLRSIAYNAGNAVIVIRNDSSAPLNGTLKIEFVIHNR